MFTGIVTSLGKFVSLDKSKDPVLTVEADISKKIVPGDSIAVNGACLTVIECSGGRFRFNVSGETLEKTCFTDLGKGDILNMELAVTPNSMLGGHLVSGHVDGTARVRKIEKSKGSVRFTFTFTKREWLNFLINKGSVSVNGVSLTISQINSSYFSVEVIPLTLEKTNLKYLRAGERVNIELDLVAKYLYNFSLRKI